MKRPLLPVLALFFFALVVARSSSATAPESMNASEATAGTDDLAKQLIGTWVLVDSVEPGSPSGIGCRLKFFTGTHWSITQPDPDTGVVVFHHGGTYKLTGDELEQNGDFANKNTAGTIHQVRKFKIKVEGDHYFQSSEGNNPFTEIWQRVK